LVGCGHIATTHLKAWARLRHGTVCGVLDLDKQLAESLARRFSIRQIYRDLEELLDDCDVVDVCTPPHSHASILERSIETGHDVFIEKPVVLNLAEWTALAGKVEASGRQLTVAHHLKFTHALTTARRWLDAGKIGELLRIEWSFLTSPESDRMLGGGEHWSHKLPGGRWFETLPHSLYGIHYLCGAMELCSVTARSTVRAPTGAPADEVLAVLSRDGCLATIHFSASCRLNRRSVVLTGTEGVIHVDLLSDLAWRSGLRDTRARRLLGRGLLEAVGPVARGLTSRPRYFLDRLRGLTPHSRIIDAFDRYRRGHGEEPTPFEEIDYVIRYCDKIGREIGRN
jgi:predicted dehydrogenase